MSSKKNIFLISIGIFQSYILLNIKQLLKFDFNIYVITESKFFKNLEPYKDSIKLIDESTIHTEFKKIKLNSDFRNGFWNNTSKRFFIIYEYMKINNIKNIIHIENDVLIYNNMNYYFEEKIYITMHSSQKCVPGIIYIPNYNLLTKLINNYDYTKNDMYNLGKFFNENKDIVKTFPIIDDSIDKNIYNENFKQFNSIFDAAAIGQYLGGIDSRNKNGDTIGFINQTCEIKYNKYIFKWIKKDNYYIPHIQIKNNLIPINNLHIHSKNLNDFLIENPKDSIYINKVNKNKNKNINMISGDKIQYLCDHFIGTDNDLRCNPEINKYKNRFINIKNKKNINNKYLIFCYTHLLNNITILIELLKCMKNNFNLIFHNSDGIFYKKHLVLFEKLPLLNIIFTQNTHVKHEKVILLPIGVSNSQWISELYQEIYEMSIDKTKNILFYYYKSIYNEISHKEIITSGINNSLYWNNYVKYRDYLIELKSHKYAVCPTGPGYDNRRFWECLYMGTIPICRKNIVTEYYKQYFPIIVLNKWTDFYKTKIIYTDIDYQYLDMEYIRKIIFFSIYKNPDYLFFSIYKNPDKALFNNKQLNYIQNNDKITSKETYYELELPSFKIDTMYWLQNNLKYYYNCIEFSSGGSTIFFSKLLNYIDTFDSDLDWFKFNNNNNKNKFINYNYFINHEELITKLSFILEKYYDLFIINIDNYNDKNNKEILIKCIPLMKKTTIYVLYNLSNKSTFYKWKLEDFHTLLSSHYNIIDFKEVRILYPMKYYNNIIKEDIYNNETTLKKFESIKNKDNIYLYAGDLKKNNKTSINKRYNQTNKHWIGLTLPLYNKNQGSNDENHILFNILNKIPINDNTVDIYQSEDVHNQISFNKLIDQINDIYRILKPNGIFRLSLPDYNCDYLNKRVQKDKYGNIIFDKGGGGYLDSNNIAYDGTVWFPNYENVKRLLENTKFKNINFLHYWTDNENYIVKKIDYTIGYVSRTPDHDNRVKNPRRPMSIVVDCYK